MANPARSRASRGRALLMSLAFGTLYGLATLGVGWLTGPPHPSAATAGIACAVGYWIGRGDGETAGG
jgi:uncharacterized oligopeptide transporter (OPT) family protein